jgi:hypothetical protein
MRKSGQWLSKPKQMLPSSSNNTTKNNVDYGEEERKINFLLSTVFLIEAPLIIMGLSIQTPIKWQSLGCWWRRYLFETKKKCIWFFLFSGASSFTREPIMHVSVTRHIILWYRWWEKTNRFSFFLLASSFFLSIRYGFLTVAVGGSIWRNSLTCRAFLLSSESSSTSNR